MRVFYEIFSVGQAKQKLSELGIHFDKVISMMLEGRRDYFSGKATEVESIHRYFMQGNGDIAYYTPTMGSLAILDQPRAWSPDFLDKTVSVGDWQ